MLMNPRFRSEDGDGKFNWTRGRRSTSVADVSMDSHPGTVDFVGPVVTWVMLSQSEWSVAIDLSWEAIHFVSIFRAAILDGTQTVWHVHRRKHTQSDLSNIWNLALVPSSLCPTTTSPRTWSQAWFLVFSLALIRPLTLNFILPPPPFHLFYNIFSVGTRWFLLTKLFMVKWLITQHLIWYLPI